MKFKTKGEMRSDSGVDLDAAVQPIAFTASAGGSIEAGVSSISAGVSEIPLKLAIPFLRPRRAMQVVAAIGDFSVALSPFYVKIEGAAINLEGVLGTDGVKAKAAGKLSCQTEMALGGTVSGRLGTFTVELEEEDLELL